MKVVIERAEEINRKNKYQKNGKKRERKGERRETSMKLPFPGRPSFSNIEAIGESLLCYDKESSKDVQHLASRTNTNYICLLCGEYGHNRELRCRYVVCSG
jgi:hypothetical protein